MLRTILVYGTAAGLLVGVPISIVALFSHLDGVAGMVVGYLIMLVAFSMVFLAIKRRRDGEGGGVIRFWPALGLGLGISVVAGLFYVLSWEVAQALSGADFAGTYARGMVDQARARGATGPALARAIAEAEQFRRDYGRAAYRLPMTFMEIFPVGVLVSLVSAALLRNPRILPARRDHRGYAG